jgi:hypothetical protein
LTSTPWFFPAQWNHVLSCTGLAPGHATTLGISVVDDRELASALSIPGAESPLVAPGDHIYVDAPAAPPTASFPACDVVPYPPAVTLPAVFTGSSVGSALVAATAARVQDFRVYARKPAFRADVLARLMYLGGETLCSGGVPRLTATPDGDAVVRRLHVGRVEHLVGAAECSPLLTCAESAASFASVLDACRHELATCGLETLDLATDTLQLQCAPAASPVSWPTGYSAPICPAGGAFDASHAVIEATGCQSLPAGCYGGEPYRALLGSLGPQPTDPGCGECLAQVSAGAAAATLYLELNAALKPGTTFKKKYLEFIGWDLVAGAKKTYYTSLDNPFTDAKWFPGASLVVSAAAPTTLDWAGTKITLIMTVNDGSTSTPALDYSPLRVDIVP